MVHDTMEQPAIFARKIHTCEGGEADVKLNNEFLGSMIGLFDI